MTHAERDREIHRLRSEGVRLATIGRLFSLTKAEIRLITASG